MKRNITYITFFLSLLSYSLSYGQADIEIPPQITEVLEYLQSKEATKAQGRAFKIKPVSWKIFDVDEDGVDEIFLQTVPHYEQTPTISIFQKAADGSIVKKLEGFAPGKLLPLRKEDKLIDPHAAAYAHDIPLSKSNPKRYRSLADSAYLYGLHVILFKNYAHTDTRKNLTSFVDLTYLETDRTQCGDFRFAQPDQIAAGKMAGQKYNFFVAKVDDRLYCYEIRRFSKRGFIEKTVSVVPLPEDFLQLEVVNDQIRYRTKNDKTRPLKL